MTVDEFRLRILEMAQARMGLEEYCGYLNHKTREDKYLREEYIPVLAVIDYTAIPGNEQIDVGNETEDPDAKIGVENLFEVVQALPAREHEIRHEIASGGASPATYLRHSADHHQFPSVILDAIESKHKKRYPDCRSLIVVFGGDYSGEDDEVIAGWVQDIRSRTTRGTFKEIMLVELDRRKVFPLFVADGDSGRA